MELQENVPLAPLTTIGVGGAARFFVEATSVSDIEAAVSFGETKRAALFVLGGGSNLVVSDGGWNGLVLKIGLTGIKEGWAGGRSELEVGAGEDWDKFVSYSVEQNLAGIECLSGIPGSVGGTPVQNVGAYGQEVSGSVSSVLVFDMRSKQIRQIEAAECGFSYRTSIFNTSQSGRYIILRVSYRLIPGGKPSLRYADLQKYFAGRDGSPALSEAREAVRQIRASKGMLISPGDPDSRSAGSFFKNPVLSAALHDELSQRAAERGLLVPSYPALSEHKKVSAAWLVESSGFKKGYTKGRAGISNKHALAIVNRGGASAAEIVALKEEIQAGVGKAWGIRLEPEPMLVGC